jgi:hypothetical protein
VGALDVCLSGRNEVGFVGSLPLDQEHQLAARVRGTDDLVSLNILNKLLLKAIKS